MANKNVFAPPSKEELEALSILTPDNDPVLSSPPSDEEMRMLGRSPSDMKTVGSLMAGRGIGTAIGRGVEKIGEWNEKYLAAPTRAGIASAIDEVPLEEKILPATGLLKMGAKFGKGFVKQFGEDPSLAETPTNLRRRIISDEKIPDVSLSDAPFIGRAYSETGEGAALQKGGLLDPTLKGSADTLVNIAADVGNFIPFEKAITPVLKGAKLAANTGAGVGVITVRYVQNLNLL